MPSSLTPSVGFWHSQGFMTVHFIDAGPGAPDLITLRGRDLIAACPVCPSAGSLVPAALLAHREHRAAVLGFDPGLFGQCARRPVQHPRHAVDGASVSSCATKRRRSTCPFFMSDLLLKPGMADFAVSVGRRRLGTTSLRLAGSRSSGPVDRETSLGMSYRRL